MFHPNDPMRGSMLLGLETSMQEEIELIERRRRFAKARRGDYLRIDLPEEAEYAEDVILEAEPAETLTAVH